MNDGFLMLNCCSTPLSRFDSSPQGLKSLSLRRVARSDGVSAKDAEALSLRSECDFGRPMIAPTNCIFLYQPHLQSAPLEGADGEPSEGAQEDSGCRSLRSVCDFRATDDRPYELHIFCISHTYNRLPLRGADGGTV